MQNILNQIKQTFLPILFAAMMMASLPLQAQFHQILDTTIQHGKMTVPCVQVTVMVEPDVLKDAWEDYLKDNYDVRLRGNGWLTNKALLSAKKIDIVEIAPIKIDLFTKIEPRIEGQERSSQMSFYTFMGYEIPTDPISYPLQYRAMKGIFQNFLGEFIPNTYEEELEMINDELLSLKEEKQDAKEVMKELKEEINENQQEITELREENTEKLQEIDTQKMIIESIEKDLLQSYMEMKWYETILSTQYAEGNGK